MPYILMEMPAESWGGHPAYSVGCFDTLSEARKRKQELEAEDDKVNYRLSRYIVHQISSFVE